VGEGDPGGQYRAGLIRPEYSRFSFRISVMASLTLVRSFFSLFVIVGMTCTQTTFDLAGAVNENCAACKDAACFCGLGC